MENVENYHNGLPAEIERWLLNERGLSKEVIEKFKIGWDGKAITIPIYDRTGKCNFHKYRNSHTDNSDKPKYWYSKDSSAEIYGWEHIIDPRPSLIICEGELDRLILESNGLPAITATSGAGTFKEEWIDIIKGLPSQIFLCFDNDMAGINGVEKIAQAIPQARIIQIPAEEGIKDITDFITRKGVENFKKLIDEARTLEEIEQHNRKVLFAIQKDVFPEIELKEIVDVLGLTIKKDETNKVITFLCQLSAYTENSQFNISFNAPSSTGKSYLPLEVASLFPTEDVKMIGYCSPTAFFHDAGVYDKVKNTQIVDLSRKILIFLDQPHTLLLQHLRPLLSHDQKEMSIKITDKSKGVGHRTKNIVILGFPAVIFCSAGLKLDEQEVTRFILLSPEVSQEKIGSAISEKLQREVNGKEYWNKLNNNPERIALKERIRAIRDQHIDDVKITDPQKIESYFLNNNKKLKARYMRDIGRLISVIKACALLNAWNREIDDNIILASNKDVEEAIALWDSISRPQEYNLPPYVYDLFMNVILPCYQNKRLGITRQDLIQKHYELNERPLPDWQLRREILPMLEMAGLISQETDPNDRRKTLIHPCELK